jgi:tetratricopeptide (TPR) repeat protein
VVRISNSEQQIFRDFPCEFHIAPGDEQKTRLFGTADILVYASHYDSCPRPPLEGMASGAAVVCTSTPGAEEYCRHEENCLLVPPRNPEAIGAAIERLMDDSALRERLVRGGFATAAQFPREREWDELEGLLFTFLGKEPVGPLLLKHLAKQGKFTEALAEAEKLPSDRDEGLQLFKGHCHLQLEDLEAAKACFEHALTINPNSSRACEGVGEVLFLAGLYPQSKSMFEWAIRNNPLNATANEALVRVNAELNLPVTHNSLSGGVPAETMAGGR